jgi:hypothetical protein
VDVGIDLLRRQIEEQDDDRRPLASQVGTVDLLDDAGERARLDPASADEEADALAATAAEARGTEEAAQPQPAPVGCDRQQATGGRGTVEPLQDGAEITLARTLEDQAALAGDAEAAVRMAQGVMGGDGEQRLLLVAGIAEEAPAGRETAEEVMDAHGRPDRAAAPLLEEDPAVAHHHPGAGRLGGRAGQEGEVADGGDAGQRLAAEAQGGDAVQIVERAQFAGGVAGQGQGDLGGRDATAIVCDPDEVKAGPAQLDPDLAGAGVQTVFDEFFQGRRRPVDDLAGGDPGRHLRGQEGDGHPRPPGAFYHKGVRASDRRRRR